MVTRSFKVKKKDFERKPLSVLQYRLRVFLKCYTIRDMILDEINFKIKFKKSHRASGIKVLDPKEYTVYYETIETDNPSEIILQFTI
jgi:hypothetical protein